MLNRIFALLLCLTLLIITVEAQSYERPTGNTIVDLVTERYPGKTHPRLILTPDKLTLLKTQAGLSGATATDDRIKLWVPYVIQSAEAAILKVTQDPLIYSSGGMLDVSRKAVGRIPLLALAYALTERQDFLDATWQDMSTAIGFADWNPDHFLDTAEMAAAVAFGFDWCYNGLDQSQRLAIKNALRDKVLQPAYQAYTHSTGMPHNRYGWHKATSNWSAVGNGGVALAALAVADESDVTVGGVDLPKRCLEKGLVSLENMLAMFNPDGAWFEGTEYWMYMIKYFAWYMSALETAAGSDFGCLTAQGLDKTGYFHMYLMLQTGTFNFGDSPVRTLIQSPELVYLGNKFNNTDFLAQRYRQISPVRMDRNGGTFDVLWYDADKYTTQTPVLSNAALFSGTVQIATLRGDNSAVVLKGGNANVNHGHHDLGSFVYDANGVRWAMDLGAETYYSDSFDGNKRYLYYRNRMEGHNTLVLNPSQTDSVNAAASADLWLQSDSEFPYAVAEMTNIQSDNATSARRGIKLVENTLVIQDEITPKQPNTNSWWFMHTEAAIDIKENGKAALLERNGKYLYAKILSAPTEAVFTERAAAPLMDTGSKAGADNANIGISKLSINATLTGAQTITVALTPINTADDIPNQFPVVNPINLWHWNTKVLEVEEVSQGAEALIDGNYEESWSTNGFSQAVLDLGSVKEVNRVALFWGDRQGYEFNIHTSVDGEIWGFPFRAGNSEATSEVYAAQAVMAQYVRITVDGNLEGGECDLYEVVIQ